jgi:putative ABC transport system permease protein
MPSIIDGCRRDLGYAIRALLKSPGFTSVALLSLAIGIAANTTIFTFVDAVLLRPLPYPDSTRIAILLEQPQGAEQPVAVHPANFLAWQARARSFESLALVQTPPLNVLGATGAEQVGRIQTTADLFSVFGVRPVLGRGFTKDEMAPGDHPVVILGHGFWQRWFGGDPSVVGKQLRVTDGSLTIIGVAPELRLGSMEPEVFTPLGIDPANPGSIGSRSFQCYGRLRPGVTVDTARAEMATVASTLSRELPFDEGMGVFVSGLHDYLVTESRRALQLLTAIVVTVLLIACANLAGLLLARGFARRGEFAVRTALGAGRGRLIRQLVIESLVLSVTGGLLGLALASMATGALLALAPDTLTAGLNEPVGLNLTAVSFTFGLSTLTAFVFGLVPAWQAAGAEPHAALQSRARGGTADRRHHRIRSLLVVAEVALAVVLLVGAGLLLRTFDSLNRVGLGFEPAEAVTMNLFLGVRPPEARIALVDQILERVEAIPGVKAAGTIQFLPLAGRNCGTGFWIEGQSVGDASRTLSTDCSLISRGYFAAMGIPLVEGRVFDGRDRLSSPRVLVVNQSFATRYFPQGKAVGHRILVQGTNQALAEIVGIVGDIRHNGLTSDPLPTVFLLHAQTPGYITNLVVRTSGEPGAQTAAIRRAIHDVDPSEAVSRAKTMDELVGDALAKPRLYATLVTAFALVALLLAAIGVYGLVAYVVSQRTHEIGIRLALGATRARVFGQVFGTSARLVVAGFGIGLAGAVALRDSMSGFLFGITSMDPATYLIAAFLFSGVALVAVTIPARRAALIDPMTALRDE